MLQIVYVSVARLSYTPEALKSLKKNASERNKIYGVTGLLLFRAGAFFEVLEGPEKGVNQSFDEIRNYETHGHIRVLVRRYIHKPEFEGWSMFIINPETRLPSRHGFANPEKPLPLLAPAGTAATRHMHLFAAGFQHPLDLLESGPAVTPGRPRFETPNGLYRAEKPHLPFRR